MEESSAGTAGCAFLMGNTGESNWPMSSRAMIVDDEPFARDDLRFLLSSHDTVEVVCEAGDLAASRRLLQTHNLDILFLDIQLGERSGFELVCDVPQDTAIIFVTAWDCHAIRAFDVNAVDYLLKPVSPRRLAESLQRLESRRGQGAAATWQETDPHRARRPSRLRTDQRLWLGSREQLRYVQLGEIAAVSALGGNYSAVRTTDGLTTEMRRTLKEWEAVLPDTFVRVHRGAIVNLGHVKSVYRTRSGEVHLELPCLRESFTVSRRRAGLVNEVLVRGIPTRAN